METVHRRPRMPSPSSNPYRERAPHPFLRPWIECFWTHDEPAASTPKRVLPDGCADFLFDLAVGRAWLIGAMSRPFLFEPKGAVDIVAVRFRPGAVHALVQSPIDAWTDDRLELGELGAWARSLVEQTREPGSSEERVDRIEQVLLRRLESTRMDAIDHVLHTLAADPAGFRVGAAADGTGLSRQWITRTIRARAGLGPKELARILRLRSSLVGLRRGLSIADAAFTAGFADQAHLARETRRITGTTPRRIRQETD
jgi:AraC-like DNA-binding protein